MYRELSGLAGSRYCTLGNEVGSRDTASPGLSRWLNSQVLSPAREFRDRPYLELVHDACAVSFDGALARAEIEGDLLVELAADHMRQDFALTSRQAFVARPQITQYRARFSFRSVPLKGSLYRP